MKKLARVYQVLMFLFEAFAVGLFLLGYFQGGNFNVLISGVAVLNVSIYFHLLYYFELKMDEVVKELKETISYGG